MLLCPRCSSQDIVKNGSIHNGTQKYKCKNCNRQFVENPKNKPVSTFSKEILINLLVERISIAGIARVLGLSKRWTQEYINNFYKTVEIRINEKFFLVRKKKKTKIILECDEMWSFVSNKNNKLWIWLAIDKLTRQIVGIHIGKRDKTGAQALFDSLPNNYKEYSYFYTDFWKAYQAVLPENRHTAVGKETGKTNHIERFNNTIRQRLSRFVRKTLSFSKSEFNHTASLYYFINYYNQRIFENYCLT